MTKLPWFVLVTLLVPLSACELLEDPNAKFLDADPVSFKKQVVPVFEERKCQVCHTKKEDGADLGDLTLDAKDNKIYQEIAQEVSPNYRLARIDLNDPEDSLILVIPLGDPNHPVGVFQGEDDPDYQTVLTWIGQGALDN